jgi:4-coumarate--CoA ligase
MTHYLKLSNAKVVFTSKQFLQTATAAADAVGLPRKNIILLDGDQVGFKDLISLVREGTKHEVGSNIEAFTFPPGKNATNVCAFLSFSSGTTGLPKAVSSCPTCVRSPFLTWQVQLTHMNMIAQCYQVKQVSRPEQFNGACIAVLPFFHSKLILQ